jgi:hypothetical protein
MLFELLKDNMLFEQNAFIIYIVCRLYLTFSFIFN